MAAVWLLSNLKVTLINKHFSVYFSFVKFAGKSTATRLQCRRLYYITEKIWKSFPHINKQQINIQRTATATADTREKCRSSSGHTANETFGISESNTDTAGNRLRDVFAAVWFNNWPVDQIAVGPACFISEVLLLQFFNLFFYLFYSKLSSEYIITVWNGCCCLEYFTMMRCIIIYHTLLTILKKMLTVLAIKVNVFL